MSNSPFEMPEEATEAPAWLVRSLVRLETKMDLVIQLEPRVSALEKHRSWLHGAIAAAGALGTAVGWLIGSGVI